jgi:hypothetical protein
MYERKYSYRFGSVTYLDLSVEKISAGVEHPSGFLNKTDPTYQT